MLIAGGDGIFFASYSIICVIVQFFIYRFFGQYYSLIKQISISNGAIVFKYLEKNKLETVKFSLDSLEINATLSPYLFTYDSYHAMHPQVLISLLIVKKDGTKFVISDSSDDIDHSLELLKFLIKLDCFSYTF